MAFRREALEEIKGFNPIYLRAGDDVDVCWRLQARGWRIGFASAALVWHHHRSSVKAYWRQQLGYGEGERWLMAHHPDKFLDGKMMWRGRIYSPLPFVRSLWGAKINAGVWGTSAFPSVYRTDVHPFAFLPHSVRWQVVSFILTLAGIGVAWTGGHEWAATLLLGSGIIGLATTIAKNVAYALRSEVGSLPGPAFRYRAVVAYLHFIQPFARIAGWIRGVLSPPQVAMPTPARQTSRGPRPSLREASRALLLLSGSVAEDRFWSETWTSTDRVLRQLTLWLRRSRAVGIIEIDDGWSDDRDVSVLVGRWAWLDARALVEDHGSGKGLLRVSTHLRPTGFGILTAVTLAAALLISAVAGVALRWPYGGRGRRDSRRDADRPHGVADGAGDRDPEARRRCGRDGIRHDPDETGTSAAAADRALDAARVRHAQRGPLSRDDPRARHRHLHAARGRQRRDHRRGERLRG